MFLFLFKSDCSRNLKFNFYLSNYRCRYTNSYFLFVWFAKCSWLGWQFHCISLRTCHEPVPDSRRNREVQEWVTSSSSLSSSQISWIHSRNNTGCSTKHNRWETTWWSSKVFKIICATHSSTGSPQRKSPSDRVKVRNEKEPKH